MNLCNNKPPTPMTQILGAEESHTAASVPQKHGEALGSDCQRSLQGAACHSASETLGEEKGSALKRQHRCPPSTPSTLSTDYRNFHRCPCTALLAFLKSTSWLKCEISANCSMYCILKSSGILVSVGNPGFCWLNKSVSVRAASPLKWASHICGKTH